MQCTFLPKLHYLHCYQNNLFWCERKPLNRRYKGLVTHQNKLFWSDRWLLLDGKGRFLGAANLPVTHVSKPSNRHFYKSYAEKVVI